MIERLEIKTTLAVTDEGEINGIAWPSIEHELAGLHFVLARQLDGRERVVYELGGSGHRVGVERIHGPSALQQAPILVAAFVAEPRHRVDPPRRRADQARGGVL